MTRVAHQSYTERHRPFFALRPPAEARSRIAAVRDGLIGIRSPVGDDRLHITMLMIEDLPILPDALLDALLTVGEELRASAPDIVLDRLVCSPGNALLLPEPPQPALRHLQRQLAAALDHAGIAVRAGWRFSPHVTLGYRPREQGSRPIDPIRWRASELMLLDSWVGLTHHETLGCWPLPEQLASP